MADRADTGAPEMTKEETMTDEELVRWWFAHSAESHRFDEVESNGGGREGSGVADSLGGVSVDE